MSTNVWKASKLGIRVFDQQKNARKGHLPHSLVEEFIAFPSSTEPNAVLLSVSSVKGRGEKNINTSKLLSVLFWRQSRVEVFESVWKPCISVTCSLLAIRKCAMDDLVIVVDLR